MRPVSHPDRRATFAVGVAALCVGTWLYGGYRYGIWPQPGFLNYVLHYDGSLLNDWSTQLPPYHWFISKGLGVLPVSALKPAVAALWVVELSLLWAGFLGVCRALGAPLVVAVAAGLVLIPTGLAGVGESGTLHNYFYPTDLSFALALAALALGLHTRWLRAGIAAGLAILVHPGVGILSAAVVVPALVVSRPIDRRVLVRLGVPAGLLGLPSVAQALTAQVGGSNLSTHERYELVAIVRLPHHMLYRVFPAAEYAQTVAWTVVALASLGVLLIAVRRVEVRALVVAIGLVLTLAVAGGLASEHGGPLVLVEAQTARVTPFLVVIGSAAVSAALAKRIASSAAAVLVVIFLTGTWVSKHFVEPLLGARHAWVTVSFTEACLIAAAIGFALVAAPIARRVPAVAGYAAAAVALAAAAGSLVHERSHRAPTTPPAEASLADIGARVSQITSPGTVALTPPDQDLTRFYSHRALVVEFGDFRFGKGDEQWVQRMRDVTQNRAILDPNTGPDAATRSQLIARSYDRVIATSKRPLCKYHTPVVIARAAVPPPPWLERLYTNADWQILKVRAGTCA